MTNINDYYNLNKNAIYDIYTNLNNIALDICDNNNIEGNYNTFDYKCNNSIKYSEYKQANLLWCSKNNLNNANICEIGFNTGHSSIIILEGHKNKIKNFTIFDINYHPYMKPCFNYIKDKYKNVNINLIEGDSIQTIPEWINNNNNSIGTFSLIHIDGGHSKECIENDMKNADILISYNGIIIIDDTNYNDINDCVDFYIKNKNYEEIFLLEIDKNYIDPHRIIKKKMIKIL
jgi:predicted O-methyltransferase YrrM